MSQAMLAIHNILQNSNTFNRYRETVLFTPFGDKKVKQFSGFLPTSVSYLKKFILISCVVKVHSLNSGTPDGQTKIFCFCRKLLLSKD